MAVLLQWIKRARWHASLSHCFEGLLIQIPMTIVTSSHWYGAASVVVWYWSRKKLEVEISSQGAGDTHVDVWTCGWFPWEWDRYKALDVLLPAASSFAIAALAVHLGIPA
ncbi:hypothetical protein [Burkholderia sp. Ac-20349]|uniref:hypothetical protein n=1 Tax=Burkholderia sp. Ac-20349 TaxID=2703893 RepID=UPI00197B5756|nr:hypothetical protein [Burkholderia sp. Ac-20349]MBN3839284.1 hypothetical protein [Burkholderia sp. Ac-20349]